MCCWNTQLCPQSPCHDPAIHSCPLWSTWVIKYIYAINKSPVVLSRGHLGPSFSIAATFMWVGLTEHRDFLFEMMRIIFCRYYGSVAKQNFYSVSFVVDSRVYYLTVSIRVHTWASTGHNEIAGILLKIVEGESVAVRRCGGGRTDIRAGRWKHKGGHTSFWGGML